MTSTPHIIEVALLLLLAFVIGCAIGYFLKKLFSPKSGATEEQSHQRQPEQPAAAQKPVSEAEPAAPKKPAKKPAKAPAKAQKAPATKKAATTATKSAATAKRSRRPATKKSAPASSKASTDGAPEKLAAPRGGSKDDLKKISGIGPKIESTLNELGVYHFDQVAAWDRKTVNWVDENLSFKGRIDREKWVAQAKKLAKDSTAK